MMTGVPKLQTVQPEKIEKVDLTKLYIDYITARKTLDIVKIRAFVREEDCIVCIDNVHGATRDRLQRIIGESVKIKYSVQKMIIFLEALHLSLLRKICMRSIKL